eukprot:CAMPEP_0196729870 /NCGR_PEP_ID=MMETSP1091-20130531/10099_1 /TAXON_ID=302021 /ORGANISM="Rhodomonas sp., Strain CCMP768" /LENGTH=97 /DNA_ID=CAMNT_0042072793 /DNA_START=13 /DNA_END=306 /DNA_ORIENTATION=-
MFELVQHTQQLLTACAPGIHVNGHTRGVGVTCYSHNGVDLYCNKPDPGTCWTTGGYCPPVNDNDEILPTEGVTAFCGLTPLSFSGSSAVPAIDVATA